jgi:hypothetical protein
MTLIAGDISHQEPRARAGTCLGETIRVRGEETVDEGS